MMRITITPLILSVLFISPFYQAEAQTLLAPEFLNGDSYTIGVLELSEAGEAGENMVWDYSNFTTVQSYNAQILAPSPSPFEDDYPDANSMLEVGGGQYYYDFGPDFFEFFGGVENETSYPYSESVKIIPYPFSYGEMWNDTSLNVLNILGTETFRSNIIKSEVDGYGTLDLPGGVHLEDVTRLSITREATDSSFVGETTYIVDGILFYSGTIVSAIVTHINLQIITELDTTVQNFTEILQSYTMGLDEMPQEANGLDFAMFPNPASNIVQLIFPGGIANNSAVNSIEVRDVSGRLIETINLVPGLNSGMLDVSSWAKGIYTVTAKSGSLGLEQVTTKQLIVE